MSNKIIYKGLLLATLVIAFISTIDNGYFVISTNAGYFVLAFWIMFAAFSYAYSGFRMPDYNKKSTIDFGIKFAFWPKVIIYMYTLFLIFSGLTEKRFLSSNIQTFINGLAAIAIFYFFKEKGFYLSTYAVIITYFIELLCMVIQGNITFHLEFHDLAFSVGYIVLFIAMTRKKWTMRILFTDIAVFGMIMLAGKRIGIAALLISIVWMFFASKIGEQLKKKYILVTGIALIIFFTLFVSMALNPIWMTWADSLGINWSGRDYYYSAMQKYAEFSPTFLGLGRNACSTIITEDFPYFQIGNIHSDILRMYIECGFFLFYIWMFFYLIYIPRHVCSKYGEKSAIYIMAATIYTFLVYLTDNTELYLMNQFFYLLTCLSIVYKEQNKIE